MRDKGKHEKLYAKSVEIKNSYNMLKWILVAILLLVALVYVTMPLRIRSSKKYVQLGNEYLAQKKYLSADLAYQKALILYKKSAEAEAQRKLVLKASKDVEALTNFYKENGRAREFMQMELANNFPEDEVEAVKLAKSLIDQGEYQLAVIPAKTAVEMDDTYLDAWMYLGIANMRAAEMIELKPDVKNTYLKEAKEAFSKVAELDPEKQLAKDYLKRISI